MAVVWVLPALPGVVLGRRRGTRARKRPALGGTRSRLGRARAQGGGALLRPVLLSHIAPWVVLTPVPVGRFVRVHSHRRLVHVAPMRRGVEHNRAGSGRNLADGATLVAKCPTPTAPSLFLICCECVGRIPLKIRSRPRRLPLPRRCRRWGFRSNSGLVQTRTAGGDGAEACEGGEKWAELHCAVSELFEAATKVVGLVDLIVGQMMLENVSQSLQDNTVKDEG